MIQINNIPLPKKLATSVSLSHQLHKMVYARSLAYMGLSGYPVGAHIITHFQESIALNSVEDMLKSLIKLRGTARLASDVLNVIPLARIDRYQLVQNEIADYIRSSAAVYLTGTPDPSQIALAAYAITSSEAQDSAWTLDFSTKAADNRFVKLHKLYKSVAAGIEGPRKVVDLSQPSPALAGDAGKALYVASPSLDSVVPITDLPRIKEAIRMARVQLASVKKEEEAAALSEALNSEIAGYQTLYAFGLLHIIDHIAMLLTDMKCWSLFVSPRKSVDPGQNLERAKSLRLLATYIDSLLLYPHILAIELVRETYDKLQTFIAAMPPLDPHIVKNYEATVRQFDVYNARNMAQQLVNCYDQADSTYHTDVTVFPAELMSFYGVGSTIEDADAKLKALNLPNAVKTLADLNDEKGKLNYLLLSQPLGVTNLITDFTTAMSLSSAMVEPLQSAQSLVLNATTRSFSEETLRRLKDCQFNVPFPYTSLIPLSRTVDTYTEAEFSGGKLYCRPGAPLRTLEFERDMRRKHVNTMFTSRSLKFRSASFIINDDQRKRFEGWLGTCYPGMIPITHGYGAESYATSILESTDDTAREHVRRLFTTLSGQSFEMVTRTIANEYIRKIWATNLSSFALLYVDELATGTLKPQDSENFGGKATLVEGFGLPYGMSYTALAGLQGKLDPSAYIPIGDNAWFVMLRTIPMPNGTLNIAEKFVDNTPFYYYPAGNDRISDIKEWVFAKPLWNFALAEFKLTYPDVKTLLDRRFIYLAEALYLETNLLYTQTKSDDAPYTIATSLSTRKWPYDKQQYFLEYVCFGDYTSAGGAVLPMPMTESPDLITTLIDKAETELAKDKENDTDKKAMALKTPNPIVPQQTKLEKLPSPDELAGTPVGFPANVKSSANQGKSNKKGKNKQSTFKKPNASPSGKDAIDDISSE